MTPKTIGSNPSRPSRPRTEPLPGRRRSPSSRSGGFWRSSGASVPVRPVFGQIICAQQRSGEKRREQGLRPSVRIELMGNGHAREGHAGRGDLLQPLPRILWENTAPTLASQRIPLGWTEDPWNPAVKHQPYLLAPPDRERRRQCRPEEADVLREFSECVAAPPVEVLRCRVSLKSLHRSSSGVNVSAPKKTTNVASTIARPDNRAATPRSAIPPAAPAIAMPVTSQPFPFEKPRVVTAMPISAEAHTPANPSRTAVWCPSVATRQTIPVQGSTWVRMSARQSPQTTPIESSVQPTLRRCAGIGTRSRSQDSERWRKAVNDAGVSDRGPRPVRKSRPTSSTPGISLPTFRSVD